MNFMEYKDDPRYSEYIKFPRFCVWCGSDKMNIETDFDDNLSRKEVLISGLCQECQDKVFQEPEED